MLYWKMVGILGGEFMEVLRPLKYNFVGIVDAQSFAFVAFWPLSKQFLTMFSSPLPHHILAQISKSFVFLAID